MVSPLFTLNESKDILNYNATTSSYDQDKNEVITMHNFNINKYDYYEEDFE